MRTHPGLEVCHSRPVVFQFSQPPHFQRFTWGVGWGGLLASKRLLFMSGFAPSRLENHNSSPMLLPIQNHPPSSTLPRINQGETPAALPRMPILSASAFVVCPRAAADQRGRTQILGNDALTRSVN